MEGSSSPAPLRAAAASAVLVAVCLLATASATGRPATSGPPSAAEVAAATAAFAKRVAPEPRSTSAGARAGSGGVGPQSRRGAGAALLPRKRLVALYGAPQLTGTVIGRKKTPRAAARRLRKQARRWRGPGRPDVVMAFDLVATIATAGPGPSGRYRTRQPRSVIEPYLQEAKKRLGGRLLLDVQPGRSSFLSEAKALRPYLKRNRVDLALDPEWNVGPRGVPGEDEGSVGAQMINRVSRWMNGLIKRRRLAKKILVVHQFTPRSVRRKAQIKNRANVEIVLAFDGIGSPRAKVDGYHGLRQAGLLDGFALFYRLDDPLMSPKQVLRSLDPNPAYVYYQ